MREKVDGKQLAERGVGRTSWGVLQVEGWEPKRKNCWKGLPIIKKRANFGAPKLAVNALNFY
jgi:hypothetical protein